MDIKVTATPTPSELSQRLTRFARGIDVELKAVSVEAARDIWQRAQTYEAAPVPGYQRTGYMSRQTLWRKTEQGATVEMRAPYSIYVRGSLDADQAWMHVGRWQRFARIVRESLQARDRIKKRLVKLKERIFG